MKKEKNIPYKISSITELHNLLDLPKPLHPLVSLFDNTKIATDTQKMPNTFVFDFYNISFKKKLKGRTGYGQSYYDFDDGTMVFTAPKQILSIKNNIDYYGISFLFHPDFIRNYPLVKRIKQLGFFSYESNEALHLSDAEKQTVLSIFENIKKELHQSIDDFSQDILISHIETLLNYSQRFYKRQFLTRKAVNHDLLIKIEKVMDEYLIKEQGLTMGLPTVEYLASQVHLSPNYLSDMLRSLTGQNAQQHIHEKLIEQAKEYLSITHLSIAEIAYRLGFERPQSFNRLFKKKTELAPLEFRRKYSNSLN